MRFARCIVVFVLLLASLPVMAQGEGVKDLLKVPIAAAPSYAKRALVIGVQDYENAARLSVSNSDAKAFASFLKSSLRFDELSVVRLTDDDPDLKRRPTYLRLKREIEAFIAGVQPDSEVVFYFSGHGVRSGDRDYLVPQDGDPGDVAGTMIDYDALRARLETRRPRRCILITDACRNLLTGKAGGGGNEFGASAYSALPQFAELRSCLPREVSQEGRAQDFQGSVFTHFLVEAWKGTPEAATDEQTITFDSLRRYVRGRVSQYVARHFPGGQQNPDGRASEGSMLLAKLPGVGIKPIPGPVVPLPVPEEVATVARLQVETTPAGAQVLVDGRLSGTTPCEVEVDLGLVATKTVEVGVQAPGYRAQVKKITLTRGQQVPLSWTLARLPVAPPVTPPPAILPGPGPKTGTGAGKGFQALSQGGHGGRVASVAFSPDGKRVATGGLKNVRIWNVSDGTLLRTIQADMQAVWKVAWSSDGTTLAYSGYDRMIEIRDANTGALLDTLQGNIKNAIGELAFSPDGRILASGAGMGQKVIKLWDVASGETLKVLDGPIREYYVGEGSDVSALAFSPDGRILASAGYISHMDNRKTNIIIKFWDVATGQVLRTIGEHTEIIQNLVWSPDGKILIGSGSSSSNAIKLWDAASGQLINTLDAHTGAVTQLAVSADGGTLVSASADSTIKVWNLASGQCVQTLQAHTGGAATVAWDPVGNVLASGGEDQNLKLWGMP